MQYSFTILTAIAFCAYCFGALATAQGAENAPALMILDVEPDGSVVDETADIDVLFDAPLPFGDEGVKGVLIADIIKGSPLFSPIEGLPDAAWKDKTCAGCHQWDRENLCEQAGFYVKDAGHPSLEKQHPMGGTFKKNLRNWARGGCK